ncbi:CGNR zinc finger domain-containing protein [Mycobacterium arosiense]|uniref:Peptide chain release factor 2 n=1 Tax=Mycobacterium arosiense ATCC BAA-1401 = DSM 45069 TaxID=1265311 RepID=A0A1W9Z7G4_MYCAI|nr:CGNR zinc finger domain-containing protein [Mycobacterium arosiense]ORA08234.1 peptide chain release factor 2 [Mycobacterium arosiense ATCC BAA-1401 = DSM 45069]
MVQDFLNTRAIDGYGPDLLADPGLAGDWVAAAVRAWSSVRGADPSPPRLGDEDLAKLRAVRATIEQLVAGEPPRSRGVDGVAASFAVSDAGRVRLDPHGSGWRWLASALWNEILLSQQAGTWRRIKRCHNHRCGSTFYDRSKNNSGVWHDVKTCGNAVNLRASRARRRERDRARQSGVTPEQSVAVVKTPPDASSR